MVLFIEGGSQRQQRLGKLAKDISLKKIELSNVDLKGGVHFLRHFLSTPSIRLAEFPHTNPLLRIEQ